VNTERKRIEVAHEVMLHFAADRVERGYKHEGAENHNRPTNLHLVIGTPKPVPLLAEQLEVEGESCLSGLLICHYCSALFFHDMIPSIVPMNVTRTTLNFQAETFFITGLLSSSRSRVLVETASWSARR
jgi:hypothetical protein